MVYCSDWDQSWVQVALIVILAQIGCLVPASFYSGSCMDRIFTHFGTGDSVETNSSSFMVEMQVFETPFTLHLPSRCHLLRLTF